MPVARESFVLTNELGIEEGDHIRGTSRMGNDFAGVVTLIWYGIEEAINILEDDGTKRTVYPGLDMVVKVRK